MVTITMAGEELGIVLGCNMREDETERQSDWSWVCVSCKSSNSTGETSPGKGLGVVLGTVVGIVGGIAVLVGSGKWIDVVVGIVVGVGLHVARPKDL
eukprot:15357799-Ditylum_brightwellii.AAC.1